jgi:general stress protein YciG
MNTASTQQNRESFQHGPENRSLNQSEAGQSRGFQNVNESTQNRGRGLAGADAETRARVASAGGTAVSQDRKHMSEIGRAGGKNSHSRSGQSGGQES